MAETFSTNPHHGRAGRHPTRKSLDDALKGHDDPGMFGRMFPKLPPLEVPDAPLQALAEAMRDADPASTDGNNPKIPAGFTYLGQFVDHDITLDLTSIGEKSTRSLRARELPLAESRSRLAFTVVGPTAARTFMNAIRPTTISRVPSSSSARRCRAFRTWGTCRPSSRTICRATSRAPHSSETTGTTRTWSSRRRISRF